MKSSLVVGIAIDLLLDHGFVAKVGRTSLSC